MAMKKCKECGADVSSSAKICPNCGKKLKHTGVRVVIGILVIIIGCCAIASSPSTDTTSNTSSQEQTQDTSMTMEKFNQIETGMTYQEVVDIIGSKGTLSTESGYGDTTYEIYYWYASNGISNATISFMNGVVSAKSQIGLDN